MSNCWRDKSAPIIATVMRRAEGQGEKEIKKALHDAYPFGEREMWPYKIWLDEIARQRGLKKKKAHDRRGRVVVIAKEQERLF